MNRDTKETTSNNTKAFVHIFVNFYTCALTLWLAWKFKSEILAEAPQTKWEEYTPGYKTLNC